MSGVRSPQRPLTEACVARVFLDVDPRTLRLPPSRLSGADPIKLTRHLSQFGTSVAGMPPLEVLRGTGGELMILSGVTRATRVAKFLPGTLVRVEVVTDRPGLDLTQFPKMEDRLP